MAIEILDHTADLGIRGTSATLDEAFCEAARALFSVMLDLDKVEPSAAHIVRLEAGSHADLLVEWLSDLLAQKELTGLVFSRFEARIAGAGGRFRLEGTARGEPLDRDVHRPAVEVKGISYLGLSVRPVEGGWQTECVLDV
jgi:SHS2 domain-containing protein